MEYRHTQHSSIIVISSIIALFWASKYFINVDTRPIVLATLFAVLASLFIFFSLTVEVKNGFVECIFGPGLVTKRIRLSEIMNVHTVKNPWYAGWGIHWIPGQYVVWNVSGFDAVEIQLSTFKRFRIGTNEPNKLAEAIRKNLE